MLIGSLTYPKMCNKTDCKAYDQCSIKDTLMHECLFYKQKMQNLNDMSITELQDSLLETTIHALLMAFVNGFQLSTKMFNWESVQENIETGLDTLEDFFDNIKEDFEKTAGLKDE